MRNDWICVFPANWPHTLISFPQIIPKRWHILSMHFPVKYAFDFRAWPLLTFLLAGCISSAIKQKRIQPTNCNHTRIYPRFFHLESPSVRLIHIISLYINIIGMNVCVYMLRNRKIGPYTWSLFQYVLRVFMLYIYIYTTHMFVI